MTSTIHFNTSTHFSAVKKLSPFVGSSQTVSITTLALSLCSLVSKYVHDRLWLLLMHRLEASSQNTRKTLLDYLLPESVATTTTAELQPSSGSGKQKKTASKKVKAKRVNRRRRKISNISSSESESEGDGNIASDPSSSDDSLVCDFEDNLSDREENVDLLDSLSDSDKEISHSSSHEKVSDSSKALTSSPFQKGRRQIVLAANFTMERSPQTSLKETSQLQSEVATGKNEEFSQAVHNLCNILLQEDCFLIMKVFSDWLQAYPAVIATCSQVSLHLIFDVFYVYF